MNLAIIGASAGVGFETLQQALKKGYYVKALSRTEPNYKDSEHLRHIKGSATNIKDVISLLEGTDAVLITVGSKKKKNITMFSEMATAVVHAANEINYANPILIISGFGVGESYSFASFFIRTVIKFFLKDQYRDKNLMENIFVNSDLNWEIIQPGILSNGNAKGHYRISTDLSQKMKVGKISRADLAGYMLKEAVDKSNIQEKVIITN
ncbi:epimerase [Chryseobacterium lactis]|uniref:Epimerase n=1 Tax=Chryseobacterium lactis TaxID=1241981 RepID=A0A3G6RLP4_CHRLC|nr:NAD(P)H-binding protein [Chryseobacterium lactis]AZA82394.1 NAD(P)-dependent oxidoreductase [Chryseobacterium lactis]AZB02776.1 NAD(P)-dependent oxidoreductase [Chryseobacterium lactis]PNW13930.1 epimerase [Chryseobacterium lactis]